VTDLPRDPMDMRIRRVSRENEQAMLNRNARAAGPNTRCGICDEKILSGSPTRYVDGERCHEECAIEYEDSG